MLGALAVLAVSILISQVDKTKQVAAIALLGAAAVWVWIYFSGTVFAGSEVSASSDYRVHLLDLFRLTKPFGIALSSVVITPGQNVDFNGFGSIDNGFLYVALYAGTIMGILYLLPSIFVLVRAVRFRWRPIDVAFVAQIVLLLTVAPITQYQNFYWLFAGLAVNRPVGAVRVQRPVIQLVTSST